MPRSNICKCLFLLVVLAFGFSDLSQMSASCTTTECTMVVRTNGYLESANGDCISFSDWQAPVDQMYSNTYVGGIQKNTGNMVGKYVRGNTKCTPKLCGGGVYPVETNNTEAPDQRGDSTNVVKYYCLGGPPIPTTP